MQLPRNNAVLLLLSVLTCGIAAAQQNPDPTLHATKVARHSKIALIGPDDGLAVISAALEARTRLSAKADCSHLVHDIYERAGFGYDYASSSELYAGAEEFRRVRRPQPGDLVVWPGHVGIVVNPAQRSFYSALSSGLGVEAYDSDYWKERGRARFFRFVKTNAKVDRASNAYLTKQHD
jgi:cell wall-associated NlpC family hydrolase